MLLKLLTILVIIQEGVLAKNCKLTSDDMDKKWIFATRPTRTTWDVLHTDNIKDQSTLYLVCKSMTRVRQILCKNGKLVEKKTPKFKCPGRIKADVALQPVQNSCRRMGGDMYEVRYTLPGKNIIPLYEVCYSKRNEQALYSIHKSYGFNLAASTYKRPSVFKKDNIVSRERELSFQAANIYNSFVRLLGDKQKYVADNTTLVLERGHLVNSQDFPTYDQMDETFKYVNVMPQFRGSNRRNWKRIENWIHNLPARNRYAVVVTGSFDILSLTHSTSKVNIPMYLMPNNKNPIPLWTYKVVKYANMCYAFVTLNNDYNKNVKISTYYCRSVACPRGLTFNSEPDSGVSYCCNYNQFVRSIGRHAALC
ncbi:uncharacterized protein LOC135957888 [Calliphora vicina]|uniref:uncharacterized protein LOC135957888 n=1 Tax=Calliphora vicina TaxID=7373 RepID=UPI00325BF0BB